ncbi:MAG: bifunctional demethylmenaquinone methyltransferase/2-methoxy-6-polyprenyl-1,4-benzoquinol methylase UbiE [Bacteroidota bacterium]
MSEKIVKPYGDENASKKQEVATMFNNISAKYDFLNHFLSLGIDKLWRKRAIRELKASKPKKILDIATGTGDFALEALKINPHNVIGVDISEGMLKVGMEKMKTKQVDHIISLRLGDSENLPFEQNTFDAITVGFGVRNFENLNKGLSEMLRVLKPGGKAVVLEFSKPRIFPIKQLFSFYSRVFIPFFGKMFSKDKRAYSYLPESVEAFPEGQNFLDILTEIGYSEVTSIRLSGGIATIYVGTKNVSL